MFSLSREKKRNNFIALRNPISFPMSTSSSIAANLFEACTWKILQIYIEFVVLVFFFSRVRPPNSDTAPSSGFGIYRRAALVKYNRKPALLSLSLSLLSLISPFFSLSLSLSLFKFQFKNKNARGSREKLFLSLLL